LCAAVSPKATPSQVLKPVDFDEKSTFDISAFRGGKKRRLALLPERKQNYLKWIF
jgi:hypothetical protein